MTNQQPVKQDEIDLREYIRPLLPRWKLILLFFIIGGVGAYFISTLLPRTYNSTAVLYAQQPSSQALLRNLPAALGSGGGNFNGYLIIVLQSHSMKTAVIDRLDLRNNNLLFPDEVPIMADAIDKMTEIVSVTENKNGGVQISVNAPEPELAAEIANTMLDLLGGYVVTAAKKKVDFTTTNLAKTKQDLDQAETKLMKFLQNNDVAMVDDQTRQMIEALGQIEADLMQVEAELKQVSSKLENSGDVDVLLDMDVQKRALAARRDFMVKQRDEMRDRLSKLPAVAADYARLQRDVMILSKSYELLTEQYQLAQITQKGEDGDYQIIDRAVANPNKVAPKNGMNAAMGAFLATVLACVGINIFAARKARVA